MLQQDVRNTSLMVASSKLADEEDLKMILNNSKKAKNADNMDSEETEPKDLSALHEVYSQARGAEIMWKTDVNLKPPKGNKKETIQANKLLDFYNSLQYTLYETGCPETVDRTAQPRPAASKHGVAIAILTAPRECLAILLEGGEQCPDGMHLILSPSWVSKKPSTENPDLFTLYIHKAITFHKDGVTYLDEFKEPRRVTYFLNFLTEHVTCGFIKDKDCEALEQNLDCPMSTSKPLCALVDNKVWTRSLLIEAEVEVPISLNFLYRCQHLPLVSDPKMIVRWLKQKPVKDEIHEAVKQFLGQSTVTNKKIVVKPSGPMCFGCVGVSYHGWKEIQGITNAVEKLFADLEEGCGVLVETFVEPVISRNGDRNLLWAADMNQTSRVRATVCRDHDNVPVTTLIGCGMASKHHPIYGGGVVPESLDTTLKAFGVSNPSERKEIESEIRNKSEKVMGAMIAYVDDLPLEKKGELYSQIDVIGIDYFLTEKDGKVRPVAIEINGHDCTINCQVYDSVVDLVKYSPITGNPTSSFLTVEEVPTLERYNSDKVRGRSVRPLVRTMVARSQRHLLRGKNVLVIGAGGVGKSDAVKCASDMGINIILVDSKIAESESNGMHMAIPFDYTDHKDDSRHAKNIMNLLRQKQLSLDGCLTFQDDCVLLAALVAENMRQAGFLRKSESSIKAAYIIAEHARTESMLKRCGGDIPHWPRTTLYVAREEKGSKITKGLPNASEKKSIASRADQSCSTISNGMKELQIEVNGLNTDYQRKTLEVTNTGKQLTETKHCDGSWHDIDIVICNRKLMAAFITDFGCSSEGIAHKAAATMPSILPPDKQSQLVAAAYQSCTEIGFFSGVFNVEMRLSSSGPKLIKINARMGSYHHRDWVKYLYGVDLVVFACMVSCGIQPIIPVIRPSEHVMGVVLLPSKHRQLWLEKEKRLNLLAMESNGELKLSLVKDLSGEEVVNNEEMDKPFGIVAVKGKTVKEAKEGLLKLCDKFEITKEDYKVSDFVKYF